jgi:ethanolamine utilization microcompartment shell protein EutL
LLKVTRNSVKAGSTEVEPAAGTVLITTGGADCSEISSARVVTNPAKSTKHAIHVFISERF